jgi:hypothetical protein
VACIAFGWFIMLAPKRFVKPVLPVLDVIGPFSWLIILAMLVLPILAASALAGNNPGLLAKSDPTLAPRGGGSCGVSIRSRLSLGAPCSRANHGTDPDRNEDNHFAQRQRLRRG